MGRLGPEQRALSAQRGYWHMKQILSIQYLRGIAAVMVVIYHLLEVEATAPYHIAIGPFPNGAFGVDIFFVISGFIMWTISEARPAGPFEFMKRRIIRIVPLYWAITFATAFLSTSGGLIALPDFTQLFRSLFFIPTWNPDLMNIIAPIVKVGWTIEVEMFFYVIFSLVLLLSARYRLVTGSGVLVFLAVFGFVFGPFERATLELYTDSIVLEFAYGMILGAAYPTIRDTLSRNPKLWIAGAGLTLGGILLLTDGGVFLRSRGIICGIPALMVVSGCLLMEDQLTKRPSRFLKFIGDASYSIYLFHLMALVFTQKTIGIWFAKSAPWFALVTETVLAVGVGCFLYYFFERPLTRWARSLISR